ncbi:hypothetical protein BACT_1058 [Bifidobacterium actinocoloniiforme DSM 22766]|uniref:Uncharacterized protein n=1 Tax=Bifidobacterium actinocoloniiforme DSM 22766 TaxID=1437605 RepID=A0A086Z1F6_9BIFI|nr:hypothetical protein [Bifidobacterium actinocoloniiforme]AKV55501.1 hypothetical protein AB656_03905 [Bifidobacterium actinocoloniiforme DSM 22766]KFI40356.1 hypothetical protein BACT_1058 [Bifidobacterium actinocoloniiforme DSM 22766]
MTTKTEYTDGFASIVSAEAPGMDWILENAAGADAGDYDLDAALDDYMDRVNQVVNPLGLTVSRSGVAVCDADAEIDDEAVAEAARGVDVYEVLARHDVSGKR